MGAVGMVLVAGMVPADPQQIHLDRYPFSFWSSFQRLSASLLWKGMMLQIYMTCAPERHVWENLCGSISLAGPARRVTRLVPDGFDLDFDIFLPKHRQFILSHAFE
jgi:hypothetical protein